jgi:hypothetical protein
MESESPLLCPQGKGMQRIDRDLIRVLFQNLPGGTEENHDSLSHMPRFEPETSRILIRSVIMIVMVLG